MFEMGAKLEENPLKKQGKSDSKEEADTQEILPKDAHRLVFTFEKRKGKPVTLVGRFYLEESEKKQLLKSLKKKLATGGKAAGQWLELQGECKTKIHQILQAKGWKFKT